MILREQVMPYADFHEDVVVIGENQDGSPKTEKKLYIEGIFMQKNIKNGNKRRYPGEVLDEAVKVYTENQIANSASIGEMGHPDTPGINYERTCILTESLRNEGDNVIGKARVCKSLPLGKLLEGLISEGIRVGVSSRGRGRMVRGDVQRGFRLVAAADIVPEPSAPDAFVTAFEEKKSWLINESMMLEDEYDALYHEIQTSKNSKNFDAKRITILKNFINKF